MPDSKGNSTPKEAAKALGIAESTLRKYVIDKVLPEPDYVQIGTVTHRSYSAIWIANAKTTLRKIAEAKRGKHEAGPEPRS